jgi:hypothetical protein
MKNENEKKITAAAETIEREQRLINNPVVPFQELRYGGTALSLSVYLQRR